MQPVGVYGKQVWGDNHCRVIGDFFRAITDGGYYLSLSDARPSAKTLLALYKGGKAGGA